VADVVVVDVVVVGFTTGFGFVPTRRTSYSPR